MTKKRWYLLKIDHLLSKQDLYFLGRCPSILTSMHYIIYSKQILFIFPFPEKKMPKARGSWTHIDNEKISDRPMNLPHFLKKFQKFSSGIVIEKL